jgi:hypothetical protein
MTAVYYVFIASILLVAGLIGFHCLYPKSRLLEAAQNWQTLIGALIGFFALAFVLSEEAKLGDDRMFRDQRTNEVRILRSVSKDISSIQARVVAAQGLSTQDEFSKGDAQSCITLKRVFQRAPFPGVSVGEKLPEIAGNVSSRTYDIVSDVLITMRLYQDSFSTFGSNECVLSPENVVEFVVLTSGEFNADIDAHRNRINEHLTSFR